MSLRLTIKYLAIALLVECIVMMFKHPIIVCEPFITENLGRAVYDALMTSFNMPFVIVQSIIYLAFCYHIHLLDIQFTDAFFGRAFRIEMALVVLNVVLASGVFDKLVYDYIAKALLEVAFAANCAYAGMSIFKYFRTEAMKKIRFSYLLWSARHLIYAVVLINDTMGIMDNTRPAISDAALITYWFLLMPILCYSRIVLIQGCSEFAALSPEELIAPESEEEVVM